jgi:hypothetical protein
MHEDTNEGRENGGSAGGNDGEFTMSSQMVHSWEVPRKVEGPVKAIFGPFFGIFWIPYQRC